MALSVSVVVAPPAQAWSSVNDYDGSGNLTYSGSALSFQPNSYAYTVTSVSKAGAAVVTITAHGLASGMSVTVAGGTGDWAGINGAQIVTVTGANTFTIAVDTSGYASTFAGTIVTNAPRTNATVWSINLNVYNGGGQLTRTAWCNSNTTAVYAWDSRTTYAFA